MLHLNRAGNPYVGSAWFKTFLEVHTETPTRLMAATLNAPSNMRGTAYLELGFSVFWTPAHAHQATVAGGHCLPIGGVLELCMRKLYVLSPIESKMNTPHKNPNLFNGMFLVDYTPSHKRCRGTA